MQDLFEEEITGGIIQVAKDAMDETDNLINQIEKTLSDDMESLQTTEEYSKIQNEFKELCTPEKIKALFKR